MSALLGSRRLLPRPGRVGARRQGGMRPMPGKRGVPGSRCSGSRSAEYGAASATANGASFSTSAGQRVAVTASPLRAGVAGPARAPAARTRAGRDCRRDDVEHERHGIDRCRGPDRTPGQDDAAFSRRAGSSAARTARRRSGTIVHHTQRPCFSPVMSPASASTFMWCETVGCDLPMAPRGRTADLARGAVDEAEEPQPGRVAERGERRGRVLGVGLR